MTRTVAPQRFDALGGVFGDSFGFARGGQRFFAHVHAFGRVLGPMQGNLRLMHDVLVVNERVVVDEVLLGVFDRLVDLGGVDLLLFGLLGRSADGRARL